MKRRYLTTDVFTDRMFGGNPLAVVLDAEGLSSAQMQAVAREFNYSETTFVLCPRSEANRARVRIFTPTHEVPFAGHPNVGTAFVLAGLAALAGESVPDRFMFEEASGLVDVELMYSQGELVGAEVLSPKPLARQAAVAVDRAAAALSLAAQDVRTSTHLPEVISVGLPFLAVEVATYEALCRARPSRAGFDELFSTGSARAVYAYTRDSAGMIGAAERDLQARMFTGRLTEDPATGSAVAALVALFAEIGGLPMSLRVGQGLEMGRPSLLMARADRRDGLIRAFVGGHCKAMFEGSFLLASDE